MRRRTHTELKGFAPAKLQPNPIFASAPSHPPACWSASVLRSGKRSGNNIAFLRYTVFTLHPVGSLSQGSVSYNSHTNTHIYARTLWEMKLKWCSPQTELLDLRWSTHRRHCRHLNVSSIVLKDQVHRTSQLVGKSFKLASFDQFSVAQVQGKLN